MGQLSSRSLRTPGQEEEGADAATTENDANRSQVSALKQVGLGSGTWSLISFGLKKSHEMGKHVQVESLWQ